MNTETHAAHEESIASLAARFGISVRRLSETDEQAIQALPRAQKRTGSCEESCLRCKRQSVQRTVRKHGTKVGLQPRAHSLGASSRKHAWTDHVDGLTVARSASEFARRVVPRRRKFRKHRWRFGLERREFESGNGGQSAGAWECVVRRVSELEAAPLTVDQALWSTTLQHLYVLFLLGIGDEGSHNVVVAADGRVVGIDLEEFRAPGRSPTRYWACCSSV